MAQVLEQLAIIVKALLRSLREDLVEPSATDQRAPRASFLGLRRPERGWLVASGPQPALQPMGRPVGPAQVGRPPGSSFES